MRGSLWYNGGALNGSLHRDANSVAPCVCRISWRLILRPTIGSPFFFSFFLHLPLSGIVRFDLIFRAPERKCAMHLRP